MVEEIPKKFQVGILFFFVGLLVWVFVWHKVVARLWRSDKLTRSEVATAIEDALDANEFPNEVELPSRPGEKAFVNYTLHLESQAQIKKLMKFYRPDYAAFVAVDATTGRILSLTSFTKEPSELGNLSLRAIFPAASVFKIVTAAAAIDREGMLPDTIIPYNGASHTLYRHNVLSTRFNRFTHHITLRDAFAKSINTVFGKLGMFFLKPADLQEYAQRFLFNQDVDSDVPFESGSFTVPEDNEWALAELASGYNWLAQMSPVQGALIAAAVANDGNLMRPYLVDTVLSPHGKTIFEGKAKPIGTTMSETSAATLRELMIETVRTGTSQKSFRGFDRKPAFASIEVGGKTGSLSSLHPKGKVDWFVGYAIQGKQKVAVAALTINEKYWRVKSAFLARSFFERYFRPHEESWVPERDPSSEKVSEGADEE